MITMETLMTADELAQFQKFHREPNAPDGALCQRGAFLNYRETILLFPNWGSAAV